MRNDQLDSNSFACSIVHLSFALRSIAIHQFTYIQTKICHVYVYVYVRGRDGLSVTARWLAACTTRPHEGNGCRWISVYTRPIMQKPRAPLIHSTQTLRRTNNSTTVDNSFRYIQDGQHAGEIKLLRKSICWLDDQTVSFPTNQWRCVANTHARVHRETEEAIGTRSVGVTECTCGTCRSRDEKDGHVSLYWWHLFIFLFEMMRNCTSVTAPFPLFVRSSTTRELCCFSCALPFLLLKRIVPLAASVAT
uniref:Uncharacterized protein n=1 Tax=Onchocerca volvulus TaxID=6282 RepID=A0A8R1TK33_ONCVO